MQYNSPPPHIKWGVAPDDTRPGPQRVANTCQPYSQAPWGIKSKHFLKKQKMHKLCLVATRLSVVIHCKRMPVTRALPKNGLERSQRHSQYFLKSLQSWQNYSQEQEYTLEHSHEGPQEHQHGNIWCLLQCSFGHSHWMSMEDSDDNSIIRCFLCYQRLSSPCVPKLAAQAK